MARIQPQFLEWITRPTQQPGSNRKSLRDHVCILNRRRISTPTAPIVLCAVIHIDHEDHWEIRWSNGEVDPATVLSAAKRLVETRLMDLLSASLTHRHYLAQGFMPCESHNCNNVVPARSLCLDCLSQRTEERTSHSQGV